MLASAEAAPFAKVGGLADVVGSLPSALGQLGVDARVVIPGYGFINRIEHEFEPLFSFDFRHRMGVNEVKIYRCRRDNITFYLLRSPPYFGSEGEVYGSWDWDLERFIYFNQALMAFIAQLNARAGWFPDVLHVNDWHTSLLPFLIRDHGDDKQWGGLAPSSAFTTSLIRAKTPAGSCGRPGYTVGTIPTWSNSGLTDNLLAIASPTATWFPRLARAMLWRYNTPTPDMSWRR